ncbi:DUF4157 domain-containing protein [Kitasatospora sp. NPDC052896]|uniref:DUF4157 domain-containing protein n=1 Tax=Kitasatospora sp. NPDC052896 TaxID=3364061 RepID=UPI0037C776FC
MTRTATTSGAAHRPLTHPPPPSRPQPPAPDPPPDPPAVQAVPAELADLVRRAQGVDVSDVPIHRGPEVTDEAQALGARAFTRDGEVFLPMEAGPLDQPVAHGLLAHELTHAAQQRALGPALPPEDSTAGQELEGAAVATERWARGLGPDPAGSGATPSTSWTAPWTAPSGAPWTAPSGAPPVAGVQRQHGDVMTAMAGSAHPPAPIAAVPDAMPSASEPPVPALTPAPAPAPAGLDAELISARDRLLALSRQRPLDLDDPGDIEELAVRVYQKIHGRLRRELLVDRERAGRLSEGGPFGWAR